MNEYKYKFLKRYDKDSIEPFAINTIAQSFNERYAQYYSPKNTDNFDEETQIILFLKEIIIKSCKDLCSNEKELERQKELVDSYDIGNKNYYYSEDRELIKSLFKKNNL